MTTAIPYVAERSTEAWQALDRQHYLHPFTDFKACMPRARGSSSARRRCTCTTRRATASSTAWRACGA